MQNFFQEKEEGRKTVENGERLRASFLPECGCRRFRDDQPQLNFLNQLILWVSRILWNSLFFRTGSIFNWCNFKTLPRKNWFGQRAHFQISKTGRIAVCNLFCGFTKDFASE